MAQGTLTLEDGFAVIRVPMLNIPAPAGSGYSEHLVDKNIFDVETKYEDRSVFCSVMICARTEAGEIKRQADVLRKQAQAQAKGMKKVG
jgi:hypothetical protein